MPNWRSSPNPEISFTANDAVAPASASALLGTTRNAHPLVAYDDTTLETIDFRSVMPSGYGSGSLDITVVWAAATATSGDTRWQIQFERLPDDNSIADLDADSLATAVSLNFTTASATGRLKYSAFALTNVGADSILAGDFFRLRVSRDAADGGDTLVGDAQLVAVIIAEG